MRPAVLLALFILVAALLPIGAQDRFAAPRASMVARQIEARGISDARVLDAMARVPRHEFVPASVRDHAYEDGPLPIGHGQTISQPYIVAFMTDALQVRPSDVVLSAVTREGLDAVLETLRAWLPESPFHYDPDEIATQPTRFFAAEFIREAAFELLHQELPYSVACEIDEFREGAEPVYIRAVIYVERDSQKGIVIGQAGRTIKALGAAARAKIEALLDQRVFLDLHVKVLPKWRRHEPSLKRLGYATS